MKHLVLFIFVLIVNQAFGQVENQAQQSITKQFIQHYNADNHDAIFSMFAEIMEEALPIDKTKEFLSGIKAYAGNITKHEFVKYEPETFASYKTSFERAVLAVNISIDENSKINGLLVKPFVEEVQSEAINNLSIADSDITKEQTDLIFKHAKVFPDQSQLSIAIIKNGLVSFYGLKQDEDTLSTIDNHKHIFEIGSISKVFTSTLLSDLVVNHKVKLDDPIHKYLNIDFNNDTQISFKALSNHSSGLPSMPSNFDLASVNSDNPYPDYHAADLVDYLKHSVDLSKDRIGTYEYSNLGSGLLGYVVTQIENTTYEKALQDNIFSKYDMQHSTSKLNHVNGDLIMGLDPSGHETSNWEFSVLVGAGGIFSNVDDLSKFALAQFDDRNNEVALTQQKTLDLNDNMDIGLGWHIIKNKSEHPLIWHNGGTGGYSSSMALDLNQKNGIIILSNVSAFNAAMGNIDNLCFDLVKTLSN